MSTCATSTSWRPRCVTRQRAQVCIAWLWQHAADRGDARRHSSKVLPTRHTQARRAFIRTWCQSRNPLSRTDTTSWSSLQTTRRHDWVSMNKFCPLTILFVHQKVARVPPCPQQNFSRVSQDPADNLLLTRCCPPIKTDRTPLSIAHHEKLVSQTMSGVVHYIIIYIHMSFICIIHNTITVESFLFSVFFFS